MPSDVRIWTGSAWESIKGADGAPGPTVVSADAGNVAKLGADGRISVQPSDMDSRFVNVTGDTMTGVLNVKPAVGPGLPDGSVLVVGDNTNANIAALRNADAGGGSVLGLSRSRGTNAAPTATQAGDQLGTIAWRGHANSAYLAAGFIRCAMYAAYQAGDTFIRGAIEIGASTGTLNASTMTIAGGNVGIQWSTPTSALEVGGTTTLRSTLEVVGNITSAGTAHAFAVASINGDAVADRPVIVWPLNTARTLALTDRCKTILNNVQSGGSCTITLPTNAAVPFPIGTMFVIIDTNQFATTSVTAGAGVTLNWNGTLTGGTAVVSGGVAATVTIPQPISRVTLVKVGTDSWAIFN